MAEQRVQDPDHEAVATRIGQAVMLHRAGDREEARNRLGALWAELGEGGRPLHRATVAHYLAGTQDDPDTALQWDLRALAAVDGPRQEHPGRPPLPVRAGAGPAPDRAVRALLPRLHLSLAAGYLGLGVHVAARRELGLARRALRALVEERYGAQVADLYAQVERLERRLDEEA